MRIVGVALLDPAQDPGVQTVATATSPTMGTNRATPRVCTAYGADGRSWRSGAWRSRQSAVLILIQEADRFPGV